MTFELAALGFVALKIVVQVASVVVLTRRQREHETLMRVRRAFAEHELQQRRETPELLKERPHETD